MKAEHLEEHTALEWLPVRAQPAESCSEILKAYFHGMPLPSDAYTVLAASASDTWLHPDSALPLPLCAKAVVLDDVGRRTQLVGKTRGEVGCLVSALLYTMPWTADTIAAEMCFFRYFFQQR